MTWASWEKQKIQSFTGYLFHIGATLFRKELCLTITEWENPFLFRASKHSLWILWLLPPTPFIGPFRPRSDLSLDGFTYSIPSCRLVILYISIIYPLILLSLSVV